MLYFLHNVYPVSLPVRWPPTSTVHILDYIPIALRCYTTSPGPELNIFKTLPLPKINLTKPRKLLNPEPSNKICNDYSNVTHSVSTQMKVLNEYFLMVVFTLLLNRVHVFANTAILWYVGPLLITAQSMMGWLSYPTEIKIYNISIFMSNLARETWQWKG